MHPSGSCKCQHCGEFFKVVDNARNRGRQRYCRKAPCRDARKADSQRRWLKQPGNEDYFRGADNVARVQAWRKANPGYWRNSKRKGCDALQDRSITQVATGKGKADQDDCDALQDALTGQSPLFVGLISHLAGSALQDDIAARHSRTRRLSSSLSLLPGLALHFVWLATLLLLRQAGFAQYFCLPWLRASGM